MLTSEDLELHTRLGVPVELLEEAHVRRVTTHDARELGIRFRGDLSGVVYPRVDPETRLFVGCRLRRDNPDIDADGKPIAKYVSSHGDHQHLYFPPGADALLRDATVPAIIVEAEKSSLAVTAAGRRMQRQVLAIGLGGCWGWRGQVGIESDAKGARTAVRGPVPDLDRIGWKDRLAVICFDTNAVTNPQVQRARRGLAVELAKRGARVLIAELAPEDGINGPDDFVGTHGDRALFALFDTAKPHRQPQVEAVLVECGLDVAPELGPAPSGNVVPFRRPGDFADLEAKLRRLPDALRGADPLRVAAVREAVVAKLKAAKVPGATKLVNLALKPLSTQDMPQAEASEALFPNDEPWPAPVNGADLLGELHDLIATFVVLPVGALVAIPLWILHTYLMLCWDVSSMLAVISPTMRCGKTTLLEILSGLCHQAISSSNVTSAVIFRVVDKYSPTLILDEADTWLMMREELRGIINSGHKRSSAKVIRTVGDDHEPKVFSTWAAKTLALIAKGRLPDTAMDRSILIPMRRRSRDERVKRLRERDLRALCTPLRQKCLRWAADHRDSLAAADPTLPEALTDRQQDNWMALMAIADEVGGAWPTMAHDAALSLSGFQRDQDDHIGVELLADLQRIFVEAGEHTTALSSEHLLQELVAMDERPWATWGKREKPITAHVLARLLKPFGVMPGGDIRFGDIVRKGYRRAAFEDAWARYPLPERQQGNNASKDGPETGLGEGNSPTDVAEGRGHSALKKTDVCCDVALDEGPTDYLEF